MSSVVCDCGIAWSYARVFPILIRNNHFKIGQSDSSIYLPWETKQNQKDLFYHTTFKLRILFCNCSVKDTKSTTMNIFRNILFSF